MHARRSILRMGLILTFALALAAAAATAASAGGTCHQDPTDEATSTVDLAALCFTPTIARIDVGGSVEFRNLDAIAHNVVGLGAGWGRFEHIDPGASLVARFDTAGIHPFSCTLHPGMVGAIVVGDSPAPPTDQAETSWNGLAVAAVVIVGAAAMVWRVPRFTRHTH